MYGYRGSSNRPQIHNPALRSFGSCVNGTSRQFFGKSGNGFLRLRRGGSTHLGQGPPVETSLHERQFLIILDLDRPLRRFVSLVDDEPGPDGDGPIRRRGVGILAGEELQPESPQGLGVNARRARLGLAVVLLGCGADAKRPVCPRPACSRHHRAAGSGGRHPGGADRCRRHLICPRDERRRASPGLKRWTRHYLYWRDALWYHADDQRRRSCRSSRARVWVSRRSL